MGQEQAATEEGGPFIPGLEGVTAADIRYLIDRQAILDCIRRYARGVDRHDEELMASAFWPDAQINYGSWSGPPHLFTPWANAGHDDKYLSHCHNITTQTAEIDGDVAHVESYIAYFLREKDEVHVRVGIGRYIERYERRGREWRIAIREFIADVGFRADASEFPSHFLGNPLASQSRDDLSYVRPLDRRPAPGRPLSPPEAA